MTEIVVLLSGWMGSAIVLALLLGALVRHGEAACGRSGDEVRAEVMAGCSAVGDHAAVPVPLGRREPALAAVSARR